MLPNTLCPPRNEMHRMRLPPILKVKWTWGNWIKIRAIQNCNSYLITCFHKVFSSDHDNVIFTAELSQCEHDSWSFNVDYEEEWRHCVFGRWAEANKLHLYFWIFFQVPSYFGVVADLYAKIHISSYSSSMKNIALK